MHTCLLVECERMGMSKSRMVSSFVLVVLGAVLGVNVAVFVISTGDHCTAKGPGTMWTAASGGAGTKVGGERRPV